MITYTKAGPEPESPVTASNSFSSTSKAMPTAESNSWTSWPSAGVAVPPRQ